MRILIGFVLSATSLSWSYAEIEPSKEINIETKVSGQAEQPSVLFITPWKNIESFTPQAYDASLLKEIENEYLRILDIEDFNAIHPGKKSIE
ncbi:MAG: hypothetical protein V4629_00615 [Pseudomonadota bacterium]